MTYQAVTLTSKIAFATTDVELLTLNAKTSTAFAVVVSVGAVPAGKCQCVPTPSVLEPVPSWTI
jgi:hypothetical protein